MKSVTEEYEYVRNSCEGCRMISQSLVEHKGKPYEKLNLKTERKSYLIILIYRRFMENGKPENFYK